MMSFVKKMLRTLFINRIQAGLLSCWTDMDNLVTIAVESLIFLSHVLTFPGSNFFLSVTA